ncbi:lipoprotein LpqG [Mycobacteroides abscessus subsp. abscessus]|nr:lipoprotein LpqG [Mycobacteroides abscessus subsp. abscessus]SKW73240.1 lipoprotein LpqG [Mycobacteroides abscessus subsp. abscessus]
MRDLSKVSDVLDKAVTAGGEAAQLSGVSFDLQDSTALATLARERAFSDAKTRAEQYAALAGRTLGKVLRIDETGGTASPHPRAEFAMLRASSGPPVEAGQHAVSAAITVAWELD